MRGESSVSLEHESSSQARKPSTNHKNKLVDKFKQSSPNSSDHPNSKGTRARGNFQD